MTCVADEDINYHLRGAAEGLVLIELVFNPDRANAFLHLTPVYLGIFSRSVLSIHLQQAAGHQQLQTRAERKTPLYDVPRKCLLAD